MGWQLNMEGQPGRRGLLTHFLWPGHDIPPFRGWGSCQARAVRLQCLFLFPVFFLDNGLQMKIPPSSPPLARFVSSFTRTSFSLH